MIVFTYEWEYSRNGCRDIYYLADTTCNGADEQHSDEIYEQLSAEEGRIEDAVCC